MRKKNIGLILFMIIIISGCQRKTYMVTFMDEDNELASVEVMEGDNLALVKNPSKDGYIFFAWLKDGIEYDLSVPIKEDMTLNASWLPTPELPNTHKVTFDFGSYKKTQTVRDSEYAVKPAEKPVKEKYAFLGWYLGDKLYDFSTPVVGDISLVAKFEKRRIIINYNLYGAAGTTQIEIEKGDIPRKPKNPSKFGYTFTNWTINGKVYEFNQPLYEDTTIDANYVANVYVRVTFDSDGGERVASQLLVAGSKLSNLPVAKKDGYIFKYWSLNNEKFDINTKIEENTLLVAVYEKIAEEEIIEDNSNDEIVQ